MRHMINNQQFTNMDIVCSNGVLKQNKAVILLALPFLECYGNILENRDNLLIMLPDFSHEEILLAVQQYFFTYNTSDISGGSNQAKITSNIHWVGQDTNIRFESDGTPQTKENNVHFPSFKDNMTECAVC